MHARRDGSRKATRRRAPRPDKKPSLHWNPPRKPLTLSDLRRRLEVKFIALLLSSLTQEFPERTVRDTARYLLKATATRGSLHSARTTGLRGKSRRQMARVLASIDPGKLQRLLTFAFRRQVRPWLPKGKVVLATDSHLVPYWGDSHQTRHILASQAKQGTNRFHAGLRRGRPVFSVNSVASECYGRPPIAFSAWMVGSSIYSLSVAGPSSLYTPLACVAPE